MTEPLNPSSGGAATIAERLRGVVAVVVTPYCDGVDTVDEAAACALAAQVDSAGVPVLTALGNTAEVHQLELSERHALLRAVAAGRRNSVLVAGALGSVGSVVRDAALAAGLGYDAIMLHEPADPFGDGAGLLRYSLEVCDRSPLPVVLYLRSTKMAKAHLSELVQHPAVVAVKFARPDLATLGALIDDGPSPCVWINGLAESHVPAFAGLGVTAFTSGIANARPDAALAVERAAANGNLTLLRDLMRLIGPVEALRADGNARFNVAVLKEMLRSQGFEAGGVRPPHAPLSDSATRSLDRTLRGWPARFDLL